ncbi:phosphatidylserine decarboxylase proenzyme, mitochondrial-like isoform X2 [Dreissena polymorpha]|uniref:Phosphatidylserine decarboxylase proenzyme, mitochondrial n=1 Tax=Dreissena polymorpha TaxID=45954 RepID=A0A9D4NA17_DREPO|nr:phosphatidylserine decarboxylase proenzyme, mitochondrial-like isoform X2 [Dreissena polymorpha]KAH3890766.1 hypothetical protein DPMN_014854 [Dreissena polymorpha]
MLFQRLCSHGWCIPRFFKCPTQKKAAHLQIRFLWKKSEKIGYIGERSKKWEIVAGVFMVGGPFAWFLCANPIESSSIYNTQVGLYRALPLKVMSRLWGKMTTMDLPVALRQPLLGLYCRMFHVNLSEALDENLKHYCSVSEFFRRELKPGVRQVDQHSPVTSPADGTILHYGCVKEGIVEQVKGVNYSIQGFLGPSGEKESKPLLDDDFQKQLHSRPDHELFHCIIYLAPGDYHRFHSPSTWTVKHRRHFPGELLSVNPGVARWIEGLFSLNERVVYTGSWQHGFFSYTAVGATNVGSIKVYFDKDLATNTGRAYPSTVYYDKCIDDVLITKGDMIGEFNMGSTIVLIFEAPSNFKFSLYAGQKIMFGQPLGSLEISS